MPARPHGDTRPWSISIRTLRYASHKAFLIALTVHQRLVHGHQQSPEVIRPAEPARFRRDRLHTHYRNPTAVLLQTGPKLIVMTCSALSLSVVFPTPSAQTRIPASSAPTRRWRPSACLSLRPAVGGPPYTPESKPAFPQTALPAVRVEIRRRGHSEFSIQLERSPRDGLGCQRSARPLSGQSGAP